MAILDVLAFDDSWMDELSLGCNTIAVHKDDVDVQLREEEKLCALSQSSASKTSEEEHQSLLNLPTVPENYVTPITRPNAKRDRFLEKKLSQEIDLSDIGTDIRPLVSKETDVDLVFDDAWMHELDDTGLCNCIGEFKDDDDVIARTDEMADALLIVLRQQGAAR
jgi:hypothetical protein